MRDAYIKKWTPTIQKVSAFQKEESLGGFEKGFTQPVIFHEFGRRSEGIETEPVAIVEHESGEVSCVSLKHFSFKRIES